MGFNLYCKVNITARRVGAVQSEAEIYQRWKYDNLDALYARLMLRLLNV